MVWKQDFETDDIEDIDDLQAFVNRFQTDGNIHSVSLEIEADSQISILPEGMAPIIESDTTESPPSQPTTSNNGDSPSEQTATVGAAKSADQTATDADSPITASADVGTTGNGDGTTTKYSTSKAGVQTASSTTDTASSTTDTDTTTAETEADTESEDDEATPTVRVRKWPRLNQELGMDLDLPISAAAYPNEVHEFHGNKNADVETGVAYHARVNGKKEYGVFVTLNGNGFNPKAKYQEATGLLHEDEMLNGNDVFDYSQGDSVVVELIAHTDKGLSFRQLPMLSHEQAQQARHVEVLRLNNLRLSEGEKITFSRWQKTTEHTGEILEIKQGTQDPPRPPELKVQGRGAGAEYWIRPSEVVAETEVVTGSRSTSAETTDTDSHDKYAEEAAEFIETESETETESEAESDTGPNSPVSSATSRPMSASPEDGVTGPQTEAGAETTEDTTPDADADVDAADASEADHSDETDTEADTEAEIEIEDGEDGEDGEDDSEATEADESEDEDDGAYVCICGASFDGERQRRGHWTHCDEYKASKEDDSEDEDDTEAEATTTQAATTDGGKVVNPVLLKATCKYTKVAVALYKADRDHLTVRNLTNFLEGTAWEMEYNNLTPHLKSLMNKEAVVRRDKGSYEYSLTDRGRAGVEKVIEEGLDVPDFERVESPDGKAEAVAD